MNQWIDNERMNSMNWCWCNESMLQWISGSMKRWTDDTVKRWISVSMKGWINESINQRMNEPMKQWINKSMSHCTFPPSSSKTTPVPPFLWLRSSNRALARCSLMRVHQKCSDPFAIRFWNAKQILWNATRAPWYGLVHILPAYQEHSEPFHALLFFNILNLATISSRIHFADPIFQKCPERLSPLTCWNANRPLATVLRTVCGQLSQIEPRNCGNRDPTSATLGAPLG